MPSETIDILLKFKLQVTLQYCVDGTSTRPYIFHRGHNMVPIDVWKKIKTTNADSWGHWSQYFFEPLPE
jgi:hypothetical protein